MLYPRSNIARDDRDKDGFAWEKPPLPNAELEDGKNAMDWISMKIFKLNYDIRRMPSKHDFNKFRHEYGIRDKADSIARSIQPYDSSGIWRWKDILEKHIDKYPTHHFTNMHDFRQNGYKYDEEPDYRPRIGNVRNRINEIDSYEKGADGYLYMLYCIRKGDMKKYRYVGKAIDIAKRLRSHFKHGGDFSKIQPSDEVSKYFADEIMVGKNEIRYVLNIEKIKSVHKKDGESDSHFKKRLKKLEWQKSREAVQELDTIEVLGGH